MEPPPLERADRTWEIIAHLSGLLLFTAIPFGNILGPLVVWLLRRNQSPSAAEHAREALNFQLSITLYFIVAAGVTVLLIFLVIGVFLLPLLIIGTIIGVLIDVVLMIVAAVKAGNGEFYRYPATIRFV
ncbi:MAG TPA: DUF4870 domain-containing protein [Methylomirabilota bacterium]|nr:DUF4870 domain-containing protein [Methylomirabilota bacterium]